MNNELEIIKIANKNKKKLFDVASMTDEELEKMSLKDVKTLLRLLIRVMFSVPLEDSE